MKHKLLSKNEQLSNQLHEAEPIEMQNTENLQMKSLLAFANALGYSFSDNFWWDTDHFYSCLPENKHRSCVSINTMVRLHNLQGVDWHGKTFKEPFDFNEYAITKARAAKIVQQVHLQFSKKKNQIVCQKHWVKFEKSSYSYLFLGVK